MSEQDQDALIGRLIRQRAAALRTKAAVDAQVRIIADTFGHLHKRIEHESPAGAKYALAPIEKFFNIDAFVALVTERQDAVLAIESASTALVELGVESGPEGGPARR